PAHDAPGCGEFCYASARRRLGGLRLRDSRRWCGRLLAPGTPTGFVIRSVFSFRWPCCSPFSSKLMLADCGTQGPSTSLGMTVQIRMTVLVYGTEPPYPLLN